MTNDEKFDEILRETDEFFKKKVIEAYGLDDKKTVIGDISCNGISDLYDALDCFIYFEEKSEHCKHCAGYNICKTLDEIDYHEWNKLEYKEPDRYVDEMKTTTAISNNGISW